MTHRAKLELVEVVRFLKDRSRFVDTCARTEIRRRWHMEETDGPTTQVILAVLSEPNHQPFQSSKNKICISAARQSLSHHFFRLSEDQSDRLTNWIDRSGVALP